MSTVLRPVRLRIFVISLALALVAATLGIAVNAVSEYAAAPPAAAKGPQSTTVKHGTGRMVGGVWLGTWVTASGPGFCLDFERNHPTSTGEQTMLGNVPGMNAVQSAQTRFIANKYGHTKSRNEAMAAALFVWRTQHTVRFDRYYARMLKHKQIPLSVRRLEARMAVEATSYGPFTVRVSMGSGYVGQKITGTVSVRANGHQVSGARVILTSNASGRITTLSRVTTSKGRIAFTAKVVRTGAVRVDAVLVLPSHSSALINNPTDDTHQRLVIATGAVQQVAAFAKTLKSVSGPSVANACHGDCKGAAPVTVSMTNPKGSATLREFVYSNGRQVGSFDIKAGAKVTRTMRMTDGAKLTTSYCYLSGDHCVSARVANRGTLAVDCPPKLEYSYTVACPCSGNRTLTYSVRIPGTVTRKYIASVSNGRTTQSVLVRGSGWVQMPTMSWAKGTTLTLSYRVNAKSTILDAEKSTS